MDLATVVLSGVIAGVVLFLWGGFAQAVLPWGIRSVRPDVVCPKATDGISEVSASGMLYLTGEVVAFVAARPKTYYSLPRFFAIEFACQLVVGLAMAGLLAAVGPATLAGRQSFLLLVSLVVAFSTDVPYWNWWGFSGRYSAGVIAKNALGSSWQAWPCRRCCRPAEPQMPKPGVAADGAA